MKILIEGIKLTGKSSTIKLLNEINRESSIFEYRGHCLLNAPKYTLSPKIGIVLESYAKFLNALIDVDYILLRGHIFPYALAKCTNQEIKQNFSYIDNLFYETGLISVLLKINEDIFKERLENRVSEKRKVHDWDASWEKMKFLQNCYEYYFTQSKIPSLVLDTSYTDEYQIVNKIIEFQNSVSNHKS